ncbi:hypothetical protein WISP_24721 [Willisornis vidua]|uniref:UD11 glucuronosyltransferase n=1 Tax=Willisornis vidua TaxID=1566151 RepID=A0ABQ9DNE2_9PASS|nr:hypothetical protein WISP_24721 [Willisornis vidua]
MAPSAPGFPSPASWAVFFLLLGTFGEAGRLLVVPIDGSHWLGMVPLLGRLRQHGHHVTVLAPETNLRIVPSELYTLQTYPVAYTRDYVEVEFRQMGHRSFARQPFWHKLAKIANFTAMFFDSCKRLLAHRELLQELEQSHFDAILVDPFFPCGQILAEHLSLPSVFFVRAMPCGLDSLATLCPSPPSYVPGPFTRFTDCMSFPQRLGNVVAALSTSVACAWLYKPYKALMAEVLGREETVPQTVPQLLGRAAVWLLKYDFVFEFPRPLMPNMVLVGGIGCARQSKLAQEFEAMVNASGEHGIVVFSLGSMVSEIPMKKAMEIADALGTVPQTVLWRYTGPTPPNLPKNVKLVKWLPQNDLLGRYKENIQRLSELHLDRPIHPLDLAVHWVEFVMRHKGAPHLRPAAHDLNWVQYHSLDVLAFLLAVLLLFLFISFKCCLCCCRRCCGKKGRTKKATKAKSH